MTRTSFLIFSSLLCFSAVPIRADQANSYPSAKNLTWRCPIRCYKQQKNHPENSKWLEEKAQDLLVCVSNSRDIPEQLDQHCDSMYANGATEGWEVKAEITYPPNPGILSACTTGGDTCSTPGIIVAAFQCPARCSNGVSEYPTTFSFCAKNQTYALQGGVDFYRSEGKQPLCAAGYDLLPYSEPTDFRCQNTGKACSYGQ